MDHVMNRDADQIDFKNFDIDQLLEIQRKLVRSLASRDEIWFAAYNV